MMQADEEEVRAIDGRIRALGKMGVTAGGDLEAAKADKREAKLRQRVAQKAATESRVLGVVGGGQQ